MVRKTSSQLARSNRMRRVQLGTTAVEILVTLVVVAFGVLGIVGLQMRLQLSEAEAYQRSQALLLVNDMANRVAANRGAADSYITGEVNAMGTGATCTTSTTTTKDRDLGEWCRLLQGAGELASGSRVGAMVGGRGCIHKSGDGDFVVTVVWQGLTPVTAPPSSVGCGAHSYDSAGTPCINDLCRRYLTTVVRIATLI